MTQMGARAMWIHARRVRENDGGPGHLSGDTLTRGTFRFQDHRTSHLNPNWHSNNNINMICY